MTKKPSTPKPSKAEREQAKADKQRAREEEKARKDEVKRLAKEEAEADKKRKAEERERAKHNEKQMNAAERQQLFLGHADHWSRIEAEVRAAIKKREEVEKLAKEDGFTKKMLVAADKFEDPKRHAKLVTEARTLAQVAIWKGAPLNFQLDMFGERQPKTQAQVTDQAYAEGQAASASGQQRRVPVQYPAPGEAFNAWLAGFDDHQKELGGALGSGKTPAAGDERDLRPPDLRDKEVQRAAEGGGGASKLGPDEVQSGTPVARSDYEKGLSKIGDRTREIIEGAGGRPSSSPGLAREQGIEDEPDED